MKSKGLLEHVRPHAFTILDSVVARAPASTRQLVAEWAAGCVVATYDLSTLEATAELESAQRRALAYLVDRRGGTLLGDYLEFGAFASSSMRSMYRVMNELELYAPRLFGFDSFADLPDRAKDESVVRPSKRDGNLGLEVARAILKKQGVSTLRVELRRGAFADTLTPELRVRRNIKDASIVAISCEAYTSTLEALRFCAALVVEETIIFFNAWSATRAADSGQQKAFHEFLAANLELRAEAFGGFGSQAAFIVKRRPGGLRRVGLVAGPRTSGTSAAARETYSVVKSYLTDEPESEGAKIALPTPDNDQQLRLMLCPAVMTAPKRGRDDA